MTTMSVCVYHRHLFVVLFFFLKMKAPSNNCNTILKARDLIFLNSICFFSLSKPAFFLLNWQHSKSVFDSVSPSALYTNVLHSLPSICLSVFPLTSVVQDQTLLFDV